MPWKRNEDGTLVVDEKNAPIRVDSEGKEYPMPDEALDTTLANLTKANGEAADRKRKLREMETKFKPVESIDDLETWFADAEKAIKTMKNLKDKELVDAGEVENLKKQLSESYESKLKQKDTALTEKDGLIYKLMVTNKFAQSPFFSGTEPKTVLPADMGEAYFAKNFKIEDGQVVGYLGADKIYSQENPGQLAGFDEALSIIIDKYPMKDRILKAEPGGAGTPASGGTPTPGQAKSMADFKTDADKSAYIAKHGLDAFKKLPFK